MLDLPEPPNGWPQRRAGVSLCMIVRDEERFLGDALASVRGVVDEICIVDTGSKDETLEIARKAGARIHEISWENNFAKARNAALALATHRWILVLDADERLSPRSREIVKELGAQSAHLTGLWTRIFNFTEDYKGTGAMSNMLVRFFPNDERIRYRNPIHEFIALDGNETGMPAKVSPIELIHFGYRDDVMLERKKHERNMEIAEAALRDAPDDAVNWYNYGTSAMLADNTSPAISALERMRELVEIRQRERVDARVPSFVPNGLCLLAGLYLKNGVVAKAEAVVREALKYSPSLADAHFVLGKCFVAQRRFAEAREAYAAAIEDGKEAHRQPLVDNEVFLWKSHSEIGATLMEERGYELAIKWFDLALAARPKVQPVRLNRARSLEGLGRFGEAEVAFSEVWSDDGDVAAANEYMNFLLRRGEDRKALAFIEANAERLPPEFRLIMYGSAAAIASRSGLNGTEHYLDLAVGIEGVDHHRARLRGLFQHLGEVRALELLERKSEA
ncbi:MAG TPA: glycosyltransferase [Candidatus Baltobacteraceae bacterium]|jgi:glycosyltransferase involved in cell wall biosynthesis